jgi:tRNA uridine 5-carboxymethylaminomethyl modification enzyme
LVLREDNTVDRLGETSSRIGLAKGDLLARLFELKSRRQQYLTNLRETRLYPTAEMQVKIQAIPSPALTKSMTWEEFLRRAEVDSQHLSDLGFTIDQDPNVHEPVEIEVKYAGYVRRQVELIEQARKFEGLLLPETLDYGLIRGLSREETEKLGRIRPRTLGQAQRISGVNPSAIQAIMVFLKGREKRQEALSGTLGSTQG